MENDTISGTIIKDGVEISYWTEYRDDGKTMYFKVKKDRSTELKAIKGLRRNNKYNYYTKKITNPKSVLDTLIKEYKDNNN